MTTTLHCTEPFIITFSSSRYDVNNVEREVKHQNVVVIWFFLAVSKQYYVRDVIL